MEQYDIVIIGAGPAGISAGIYAVSRGKRVLVLEQNRVGGLIGTVSSVTHYTGIVPGETGRSFAMRMQQQAQSAGVPVAYETVRRVCLRGAVKTVETERAVYQAAKVILANGTTSRTPEIEGNPALLCRRAAENGPQFDGKNIYVVGGADGAVKEALYLAQFAKTLTIIHFEDQLGCVAEFRARVAHTPNIVVKTGMRLHGVYGTQQIEKIELRREQDGAIEVIEDAGCGVFVYAGSVPNTALYPELHLENGYIPVDSNMQTEIPGVYAAGDICVKAVRQVATAVADGAAAGIHAAQG